MSGLISEISPVASVIISIALMLSCGFLLTRLTKPLGLPDVTAYIVTGILIGPYVFGLIPKEFVKGTEFLPDVALSFIAFSTGQFFKLDVLKKNGAKVILITLFEALAASLLVFVLTYLILGLSLAFSIVLAALASATAPASTMMTIRQTRARGDFVNTLLQVVALDDVVSLVAYSIAISVAVASLSGGKVDVGNILLPLAANVAAMIVGALFGVVMSALLKKRSTDNRLIMAIALLFAFCGLCALADISPLLGCMSMSMVYVNSAGALGPLGNAGGLTAEAIKQNDIHPDQRPVRDRSCDGRLFGIRRQRDPLSPHAGEAFSDDRRRFRPVPDLYAAFGLAVRTRRGGSVYPIPALHSLDRAFAAFVYRRQDDMGRSAGRGRQGGS